jgi:hypothetical protein
MQIQRKGGIMQKIDLTPTPDGLRMSIRLFEQTIAHSEHLIRVADEWLKMMEVERRIYVSPDEFHIFEAALEALQEQERQRIDNMRVGIAAAKGEN